MAKIATLQTSSVAAAPAFHPLGYEEERVVLGLMMQGKSNLQIVNHHTTMDLRLTLEQVQRVRELAGIVHPASPSKDGHPSGRRPGTGSASGLPGVDGAAAATDAAGPSCNNTVSLKHPVIELPPEFKREKSEVASGAARAVSSMLVRGLRGRGWQGTLAALGIYLISIYLVFLAVAHFAAWIIHWMLEHRVETLFGAGLCAWAYSSFVGHGPVRVRLSRAANDAVRGYAMRASLAALMMVRQIVTGLAGVHDPGEATTRVAGGDSSSECCGEEGDMGAEGLAVEFSRRRRGDGCQIAAPTYAAAAGSRLGEETRGGTTAGPGRAPLAGAEIFPTPPPREVGKEGLRPRRAVVV